VRLMTDHLNWESSHEWSVLLYRSYLQVSDVQAKRKPGVDSMPGTIPTADPAGCERPGRPGLRMRV
jgi:hypothetical protein